MQPCPFVSVSSVAAFVLQQRLWTAMPEPCHPHSLTYLPALHRKHLLTPALFYFYVKPLCPRYVLLICLLLHMVVKHLTLHEISPELNVLWYLSSAWMCDMFWFTPSSSPRPPLPTLRTEGGNQVSNWGWGTVTPTHPQFPTSQRKVILPLGLQYFLSLQFFTAHRPHRMMGPSLELIYKQWKTLL